VNDNVDAQYDERLDLRSILGAIRRRRRAVALGVAVVVLAVMTIGLLQEPEYRSTTRVLLVDTVRNPQERPIWDVETEVQIARSSAIAGTAGAQLDPPQSVRWVQRRVKVTGTTDSLVTFRASGATPEAAAALATAYRDAYLDFTRARGDDQILVSLRIVEDRLAAVDALLTEVSDRQVAVDAERGTVPSGSPQGLLLASQSDELERRRAELGKEKDSLEARVDSITLDRDARRAGLRVTQESTVPRSAAEPDIAIDTVIFGLLALAIACVAVIVAENVQGRVRSWAELSAAAGAPVVAAIPGPKRVRRSSLVDELVHRRPSPDEVQTLDAVTELVLVDAAGRPGGLVVLGLEGESAGQVVAVRVAVLVSLDGIPTELTDESDPRTALGDALADPRTEQAARVRPRSLAQDDQRGAASARAGVFEVVHVTVGAQLLHLPSLRRPAVVLAVDARSARLDRVRAAVAAAARAGLPVAGVVVIGAGPDHTAVPQVSATLRPPGWTDMVRSLRASTRQPLTSIAVRRFERVGVPGELPALSAVGEQP
jgi:uncharacterized protein involved in exopolysaccharide biosynthesis